MRFGVVLAGFVASVALIGVTGEAMAQGTQTARSRLPSVSLNEAATAQRAAPDARVPQRRGLRFNRNGRWGLDFNLNQPVGRETEWGDVEAGAYYSLSPRLRVGAAAGLATPEADPARAPETDRRTQPRVRLESIFKF
jgi:long-subunit fatty acid transport protein